MTNTVDKKKSSAAKRIRQFFGSNRWNLISSVLYPAILALLIYILWKSGELHRLLNTDEFTLPYPDRIFTIIKETWTKVFLNLRSSLFAAVAGLLIGSLLGYLIAVIATVFPNGGVGGMKLVAAFNAVPIIAIAPFVNNLIKNYVKDVEIRGMTAKIIVVVLVCCAAMSINAYRGLNELKPFSEDLMDTYASGKSKKFLKLRLPNSVPYIFTALTVSVPMSVITTLVSEYFVDVRVGTGTSYSPVGVGRMIRESILTAQFATAWAYIMIACLMGIGLYLILMAVKALVLKRH